MNTFLKNTFLAVCVLMVSILLAMPASAYHQTQDYAGAKIDTHQPYAKHYEKAYVYGFNGRGEYSVNYNYYSNNYRDYPRVSQVHYTYPARYYGAYGYAYPRTYASGSGVYYPFYPTRYGYAVQSPVYVNTLYVGSYYSLY